MSQLFLSWWALLNEVGLIVSELRILSRTKGIASAWGHTRIAFADHPRVLIIGSATTTQEEGRLDASSADFHVGSVWVRHVLLSQFAADAQGTLTSTSTQDWLVFNVDLLIVIQLQFLLCTKSIALRNEGKQESKVELHCGVWRSPG